MNPRDAEAALRTALELDPQNGGARIELGALYEDQGRFAQAAAEFERAIAVDPDHGGAQCQLGRIYRRQGRFAEAEAALRKARELEPRNGWARFELGAFYQDQGRFFEAAAEFEGAIAIDGNSGGAHCQLGGIYRRQGRLPEAEAALRKARELEPQNGWARFELGALYQDQGRFVEAAVELEGAIAIDGNNGWAHSQLGGIYRRQGRASEAESALNRALELDPQNGYARIELGALYEGQSKFTQAAREFERAIAIDPMNGEAHFQLGRFYRRQGRAPEAEAALRKALESGPQNVWARIELGVLYESQDRFLPAAAEFDKAVAIDPDNVGAHLHLGHIRLCGGQWAGAEAEFQKAADLDPRSDGAYFGLWAVYRGQGRASEAAAALARALAINPNSAFVCTELLERLDRVQAVGAPGRSGAAKNGAAFVPGMPSDAPAEPTREEVFCLLPWTHLHIRTDGIFRPCCMWDGPSMGNTRSSSVDELWNSSGMKALRSDMRNGRPAAGCWKCYEIERSGFLSMRQRKTVELDRHRGREGLTAPDGTLPRLPVPFLDMRFSNLCNLRCRTCDAFQSSSWAADTRALGLPVEGGLLQKPYDDWDSLWRQLLPVLEEGVEEIRFAGGEPLIMEEHYRILDFLVARGLTDVRLSYNTNFSALHFQGRDVIDLWSRFREVRVSASLDGSGRRGEYLRKGLRWDTVVANREEMRRRCPGVAFSILATLSIFNALHLPDFHREWVERGYVDRDAFVLNILVAPAIYRMQVLPAALKQRVLESYRRHQESFLAADGPAARGFAAAAHLMMAQDFGELLPGFVAMTRRLDRLRGEDCGEVFPELAALFEAAA